MDKITRLLISIITAIIVTAGMGLCACRFSYAEHYQGSFITVHSADELAVQLDGIPESAENEITGSINDLNRIVIYTDRLKEDYGAESVIRYPELNEYILTFDTEENTETAYTAIEKEYKDKCYRDGLVCDLTLSSDTGDTDENWGSEYMGFSSVINSCAIKKDKTVTIAVIDTGIETERPEFAGRKFRDNYDLIDSDTDPADASGHGTQIAGIISECCPRNVQLMGLRVFNKKGRTTWLLLNNALQYAAEHNADVVNMSLGISSSDEMTEHHELDETLKLLREAEIPVCCAAGNNSLDVSHTYPACSDLTLAISSIGKSGAFSESFTGDSTGGSAFGEGIDFCAPGEDIRCISPGGTETVSGTSYSAAYASAALAMIAAISSDISYQEILSQAVDCSVDLGDSGKDPYYGWGCMDLRLLSGGMFLNIDPASGHLCNDIRIVKEPTCSVGGISEYQCGICGEVFTTVTSPDPLAHDWGKPTYKWSKDNCRVTAQRVCRNDHSHRETETVSTDAKVTKAATTGAKGETTYTSASFKNPSFRKQKKRLADIPKLLNVRIRLTGVNAGSRSVGVRWKKISASKRKRISGIEIQYSTDRHFKKDVKSVRVKKTAGCKRIKKLRQGKTVYIRARTYKTTGKTTRISEWSKVKRVKVH